jgi:hypothetical protein
MPGSKQTKAAGRNPESRSKNWIPACADNGREMLLGSSPSLQHPFSGESLCVGGEPLTTTISDALRPRHCEPFDFATLRTGL